MSETTWRRLVLAGLLSLSTACGSTVQMTSTATLDGSGSTLDGLGSPSTANEATSATGPSPTGAASSDGSSAVGTTGSLPSSVAGGTAAQPASGSTGSVQAEQFSQGASIPGVTDTTITIGVIAADPSTDQTLESAGLGAASLGNEPGNWQAMSDEINAQGGIAGRSLQLVFHLVNLTDPPSTQGQAACARFTEDNKVAAVLSGYFYSSAHLCLSQKGVPALLGTNYGVDSTLAQKTGTVVAWATPLLDRLAAVLPDAFQQLGRLEAGTSAGIFVTDAPPFTRSASRLSAELTRRGLKVLTQTVRDSGTGDYSGASTDASAAVLRFRSEGVTEILFLTHNAFEPTVLMQAANSQNYEPTYLLSSQQYPASLVGLVPAGQLDGALAVGWAPAIDLSTGYDTGPQAQQCLRALSKQGRTFSSGTQTLAGLLACDGVDLLKRAAEHPGALTTPDALTRASVDSATGFVSAVTIKTAFPGGRRDGVAAYRPMAYSSGCGCFDYSGAVTPM